MVTLNYEIIYLTKKCPKVIVMQQETSFCMHVIAIKFFRKYRVYEHRSGNLTCGITFGNDKEKLLTVEIKSGGSVFGCMSKLTYFGVRYSDESLRSFYDAVGQWPL